MCAQRSRGGKELGMLGNLGRSVSVELSMVGHVVKIRLGRLAGNGGRCFVGHGKEPGLFGLTFNLEIISKLPPKYKGFTLTIKITCSFYIYI